MPILTVFCKVFAVRSPTGAKVRFDRVSGTPRLKASSAARSISTLALPQYSEKSSDKSS